jgi:hypothetical protein
MFLRIDLRIQHWRLVDGHQVLVTHIGRKVIFVAVQKVLLKEIVSDHFGVEVRMFQVELIRPDRLFLGHRINVILLGISSEQVNVAGEKQQVVKVVGHSGEREKQELEEAVVCIRDRAARSTGSSGVSNII